MSDIIYLSKMSANTAWKKISKILKEKLKDQSFMTWFKPLEPVSFNGQTLNLSAPSRFYCDWIDSHFQRELAESSEEALGSEIELVFTVNRRSKERSKPIPEPVVEREIVKQRVNNKFNNNLNSRYIFDSFIEGECNKFARAGALAISKSPSKTPFNPFLVYGGAGLGKTHLIQAIGNYIVKSGATDRVIYVTSEQFTTDFVHAIKTSRADSFSRLYRSVDVLLFDDVQFLMTKERTQEEFFHTFNTLHQAGKQLIFSSDKPPKDLKEFDERLKSRLQWGLVSELHKPDFETKVAILKDQAEKNGVDLPENVSHFLAVQISDNIRTLQGALIRMLAQSSLLKESINIDLAKEALKDLDYQSIRRASVSRIQEIVAEEFEIPTDLLISKTRKKNIVQARQTAMYLCTEYTDNTLKTIGLHFGGRDHATVIHSRENINEKCKSDAKTADIIEVLRKKIEFST